MTPRMASAHPLGFPEFGALRGTGRGCTPRLARSCLPVEAVHPFREDSLGLKLHPEHVIGHESPRLDQRLPRPRERLSRCGEALAEVGGGWEEGLVEEGWQQELDPGHQMGPEPCISGSGWG